MDIPGFPSGSEVENLPVMQKNAGDAGSIPGSGRSPGGGYGNPIQYCCLENPMDRGAWQATIHRVAESDTTEVTWHVHTHGYTAFYLFIT